MGRTSLYTSVAERISGLIERGTFAPGERIPSVRSLSRQMRVSVTTVAEAYRLLEDHGVVEARPQSGHYVRMPFVPNGKRADPPPAPTPVNVGELCRMVLLDTRRPGACHLGAAVPDPAMLPIARLRQAVRKVAAENLPETCSYDLPPGCHALRVQIAQRALTAGCTLTPDDVVTTTGCQEALSLCMRVTCRPGDVIAVESPTYYGLLPEIESQGLRAIEIPCDPKTGMRLECLHAALMQHPVRACFVTPNYTNPLGSRMPDEQKKELVRLLAAREIPLIEDDVYGDIGFAPERPKVCRAYDEKGLVLHCSSFSKTVAPGFRAGWVAAGRFQDAIVNLRHSSCIAAATLPQMAVAEFLRNGGYDHHLRRIRGVYARRAAALVQACSRLLPSGTRVTQPAGGLVVWAEFPPALDSLDLYRLARDRGIHVIPGPLFSGTQQYRHCVRLSAALWSEDHERALATIGELAAGLIQEAGRPRPAGASGTGARGSHPPAPAGTAGP